MSKVTFRRAESAIVLDVDLAINAGECVAVVGPSGCGKTTLLNLAVGLLCPAQGTIHAAGQDLTDLTADRRAQVRLTSIGQVPQDGALLPELTVIENVALPLLLCGHRRKEALAPSRAVMGEVGLEGREAVLPSQLSGGQRQRVAVARGLIISPVLLVADEPTASLDAANTHAVTELLVTAARRAGAGLLVATHDARVADRMDRVLTMDDGRLTGGSA